MSQNVDAVAAALIALVRHGVPPDVQELLVYGAPHCGVPPGALAAVVDAVTEDAGMDIVKRLRETLTGEKSMEATLLRICRERVEAADTIERLRRLDAEASQVEAWICMHTDFASPPHQDEAGAKGLIAALDRLKAERDALRADAGWQPIGTAPRDGTEVLLAGKWRPFDILTGGEWCIAVAHFSSLDGSPDEPCDWIIGLELTPAWNVDFTHWRPLPAPPETTR